MLVKGTFEGRPLAGGKQWRSRVKNRSICMESSGPASISLLGGEKIPGLEFFWVERARIRRRINGGRIYLGLDDGLWRWRPRSKIGCSPIVHALCIYASATTHETRDSLFLKSYLYGFLRGMEKGRAIKFIPYQILNFNRFLFRMTPRKSIRTISTRINGKNRSNRSGR